MNNVFIQDNLINKGNNVIMNDLNYVKKEFYLKKVFYGNYVKNIVLPIVLPLEIINNLCNKTGVKNTGKNDLKLFFKILIVDLIIQLEQNIIKEF